MTKSMTSEEAQARINAEILGQIGKKPRPSQWTKVGWVFMRVSGVLLVVLIFGHLYSNLIALPGGIHSLGWDSVAAKFANPFWRWWDIALLWLALIHGTNGMRTIVSDYVHKPKLRKALHWALLMTAAVLIAIGTYAVATFDPCSGILGDGSDWAACQATR